MTYEEIAKRLRGWVKGTALLEVEKLVKEAIDGAREQIAVDLDVAAMDEASDGRMDISRKLSDEADWIRKNKGRPVV